LTCFVTVVALALGAGAVITAGGALAAQKAPTIKIILLAETKGESAAAVPYYADGTAMAAEELGSKVDLTRIPAPLVPAQTQTALLQAIDQKPDAIIGFPASSQVIAVQPTIKSSGIPTLAMSSGEQTVANGPNGASNLFLVRPIDTLISKAQADYVVNDLKAKKIGLVCVDITTGTNGCAAAKKVIDASKNSKVTVERTNGIAATDLTEIATAMKGTDAVLDYNFPNPFAVLGNQLVNNDINVPHVGGAISGIEVNSGAIRGQAAANTKGVDDCVPTLDTRPVVKKWVAKYKSTYGYDPIYSSAQAYDMVKFLQAAAAKAGSVAPAKLMKAMASLSYDGICASYKADSLHVLQHSADVVKWNKDNVESIAKPLTFAPGALPFTVAAETTTVPAAPTTTTAPK
jgi:branched-chain amino acid transport system substrate-binding protein